MSLQKKEKKRCVQKNGNVHLSQVLVIIYVVKHSTPASVQPPSARLSNNPIYTPPSALLHPTSTMGHTCYPNKDSCDWLIVLRKMISERNVRVLLSRRDRSHNRISHKTTAKTYWGVVSDGTGCTLALQCSLELWSESVATPWSTVTTGTATPTNLKELYHLTRRVDVHSISRRCVPLVKIAYVQKHWVNNKQGQQCANEDRDDGNICAAAPTPTKPRVLQHVKLVVWITWSELSIVDVGVRVIHVGYHAARRKSGIF